MNGEDWYYGNSEALGPVSKASLLGIIQRGDLGSDAEVLVLHEDSDKWMPVAEEPGLLFESIESGAKFSIMEALDFGFRTYLNIVTSLRLLGRSLLLAITAIVIVLIVCVPSRMGVLHFMLEGNLFYALFLCAFILFAETVFEIAVLTVYLKICEPGKPRFSDLYSRGHLALDYIGMKILIALLAVPIVPLLLLPDFYYIPLVFAVAALLGAIYYAIMFSMSCFGMVEMESGPIVSLQTSAVVTKGARWRLLGWVFVCLPLTLAVSASCMISWSVFGILLMIFVLTAGPILGFGTIHIYRRLLHETDPTEMPEEVMLRLGKPARMKGA
jgi:hypothetical protein